ncbi:hypothetical protein RB5AMG_02075 [Ruminococcus bromii]|nr:hypothetical protein RB5AMG_02075 [Ruminococcus bromii]DAP46842.1 MAG TPA: hypothetical protein [Caudoviricetes sp.]
MSRNGRQCATCEYWTGRSVVIDSPNFIVCDSSNGLSFIKGLVKLVVKFIQFCTNN